MSNRCWKEIHSYQQAFSHNESPLKALLIRQFDLSQNILNNNSSKKTNCLCGSCHKNSYVNFIFIALPLSINSIFLRHLTYAKLRQKVKVYLNRIHHVILRLQFWGSLTKAFGHSYLNHEDTPMFGYLLLYLLFITRHQTQSLTY